VEFRRLDDLELVRAILTLPQIYPSIGDDYTPAAADFRPNEHPEIWYVLAQKTPRPGMVGLFTLVPANKICWELHVVMLPWASAKDKWEAARQLRPWLKEHTDCKRLTAAIPANNWPAIIYGTHGFGAHIVGRHPKAFMKGGTLQDLVLLGVSVNGG
jgi:hypothetical protein